MLGLLLLTTWLHLWNLPTVPPGLWYDEAYNGMDATWMLHSRAPQPFFIRGTGREAMAHYFMALSIALVGHTTFALRLPIALLSLLAIPLMYQWLRMLFLRHAAREWLSVIGAANLGFSFWHLTMSRSGYRVSLVITGALLTAYLFWRGWHTKRNSYFIGAGVALGLSQYTYPNARFLPFIYGLFWLLTLIEKQGLRGWLNWKQWQGLFWMALTSLIIFMPLGIFFWQHPESFLERANQVLITRQLTSGNITLSTHLHNVVGAFIGGWDKNWRHGLVGTSGFETLNLVGFWIGLSVALWQARANSYRFLLVSFLVAWIPIWITADQNVQAWRLATIFPPYYALATLGIISAATWLVCVLQMRRRWIAALVGLTIICNGLQTTHRYFGRWSAEPQVYTSFEGPHVQLVRDLLARSEQEDLLIPFYLYEYPTTRFLMYDTFQETADPTMMLPSQQSPSSTATLVRLREDYYLKNMEVPKSTPYVWLTRRRGGKGIAYVLSKTETAQLERLPTVGNATTLRHPLTELPLVDITTIEGFDTVQQLIIQDYTAVQQLDYRWEKTLHLAGYRLTPVVTQPGEILNLALYWQNHSPQPVNCNLFAHVIDPRGNTMGIFDMPVFTDQLSRWRERRFLQEYEIPLAAEIPAGTYLLQVGLFNPQTLERLAVSDPVDPDNMLTLGPFYVQPNGTDPRTFSHPLHVMLGETIELLGYDYWITQDILRVKMIWLALGPIETDYTVFVHVLNEDNKLLTNQDSQPFGGRYPTSQWQTGQVLADTLTLTLPDEIPHGAYQIVVGMYNWETMQRLPARSQGVRLLDDLIVFTELLLPHR